MRDFAGRRRDQVKADAGLLRRAGAGRKHDGVGFRGEDCGGRNLVVAVHAHLRPEVPKEVDQVEGEAVVVVDEDDHPGRRFLLPAGS